MDIANHTRIKSMEKWGIHPTFFYYLPLKATLLRLKTFLDVALSVLFCFACF